MAGHGFYINIKTMVLVDLTLIRIRIRLKHHGSGRIRMKTPILSYHTLTSLARRNLELFAVSESSSVVIEHEHLEGKEDKNSNIAIEPLSCWGYITEKSYAIFMKKTFLYIIVSISSLFLRKAILYGKYQLFYKKNITELSYTIYTKYMYNFLYDTCTQTAQCSLSIHFFINYFGYHN